MCGILATFSRASRQSVAPFLSALRLLNHRGPDYTGIFAWNREYSWQGDATKAEEIPERSFEALLGHTRLSILDLSARSHQPMVSRDGRSILIFNGEIYNYRELRSHLESYGDTFITDGDTEVLLYGLLRFGPSFCNQLNGMWAFCLFDTHTNEILLSRDRYGKKPLYFTNYQGIFSCASEPKALFSLHQQNRVLRREAIVDFLACNRWPSFSGVETAYHGISQIQAGTTVRMNLTRGSLELLNTHLLTEAAQAPADLKQLEDVVRSAVSIRLRADVPIGIFISGGVDSSLVAGFAAENLSVNRNTTLITGDTGIGNDLKFSRVLAASLNIPLLEVPMNYDESLLDNIQAMTRSYELPLQLLGNSVAMYELYRAAAKLGLKVVLDGTGGDEVFCGYFDYYASPYIRSCLAQREIRAVLSWLIPGLYNGSITRKQLVSSILNRARTLPPPAWLRHDSDWTTTVQREQAHHLAQRAGISAYQLYDMTHGRLPSWLYMNDQNSMAHSVEARSPLLDFRLSPYIHAPLSEKFSGIYNKFLLRKQLARQVPDAIRWRVDKQGFRWDDARFFQKNSALIMNHIESSRLIKELAHRDALADLQSTLPASSYRRFMLRLFSLAQLESTYSVDLQNSAQ
jgi:asparagine synthase (glutamine-hydrolysing)